MGILFAFFSAVLYGLGNFISKLSVDKTKSPVAVNIVFQFLAGTVMLCFFPFEKPEIYKSDPTVWGLIALMVTMYAIFNWLNAIASKRLQISVNTVLGQLSVVLFFVASLLVFKEAVTLLKIVGVALLIGGNALVFGAMRASKSLDMRATYLKLGASLAITVAMLCDSVNSANFSVSLYGFIAYFVSGLVAWGMSRVSIPELVAEFKSNWKLQFVMAIFSALGYYFFIKALGLAPKSIVVPINNLNAVIMVMLGVIILQETNHLKRKIIAVVLAFIGAALLSI